MKKHTRSLTVLGTAAIALAAAGFGFSRWSSDINLNGSITAKANWDVAIEEASIINTSTAASVDAEARETDATVEVEVYDVYADYCTDFRPSWEEYRVHIDDTHPHTVTMTLDELNEYNYRCFVSGDVMVGYNFYESGLRGSNIQYMMNLNDLAYELGFEKGTVYADNPDGSHDGEFLGTAIGEHLASPRKNPWNIKIMYNDVLKTLTEAKPIIDYPAVIAEDGQSAVFGATSLGLPGSWAEYEVTVANNGTADANMKDWSISLDTESDLLQLDAPSLAEDTVLAPGESCTFTFVVSVKDTEEKTLDESGEVKVHLNYAQDEVEEAPAPSHTH